MIQLRLVALAPVLVALAPVSCAPVATALKAIVDGGPEDRAPDASFTDGWVAGADAGVDAPAYDGGSLVVYAIPPHDTDPNIDQWLEDHIAMIDRSKPPTGKLFVLLPGAGLLPSDYQALLAAAAHLGDLAIGLRYPNSSPTDGTPWDVAAITDPKDPSYTKLARLEILDGTDRSPRVQVTTGNGIINRLTQLIVYLDAQHKSDGWGAFAGPAWSGLAVAGHSFGGGEAVLIGQTFRVDRVILFSSPNDHVPGNDLSPPGWISVGGLTPPSAFFGLAHLDDQPRELLELDAWRMLGMDPFSSYASVNIDKIGPPFDHAHELKTPIPSLNPSDPNGAHKSTAVDGYARIGAATFVAAWQYLIGP